MHCSAGDDRRAERPKPELADVFREYGDRLSGLSGHEARTAEAIINCRTAALGGHVQECDQCEYRDQSYNSCRNRHCPKCQSLDAVRWVEAQRALLLPTVYHHVVFTIPDTLHSLFLGNRRASYALLFAAAAETLKEVALRAKNLGAEIGITAVLTPGISFWGTIPTSTASYLAADSAATEHVGSLRSLVFYSSGKSSSASSRANFWTSSSAPSTAARSRHATAMATLSFVERRTRSG